MENSWSEKYQIIGPLVNHMGRLGLYGVLNLLQETAWAHAKNIGFGYEQMAKENLIWVFTRQKIEMTEWPAYGEQVQVRTWVRPPEGAFITRNFIVTNSSGKDIGWSSASFLALDGATRRIVPAQNLRPWQEITSERTLNVEPEKIPLESAYESIARYRVRNSDLDINQHVNNTKYAQWILDAIPIRLHQPLTLKSYSVNFLAETHLGNKVEIFKSVVSGDIDSDSSGTTSYKGLRQEDEKVLFTAKIEWEKKA